MSEMAIMILLPVAVVMTVLCFIVHLAFFEPKPKQRRCKDCKWSIMKRGRSKICLRPTWDYSKEDMGSWCLGFCMNDKGMKAYGCDNYARKFWAIGRAK